MKLFNKIKIYRAVLALGILLGITLLFPAQAQIAKPSENQLTRLLFVFDASQSMVAPWNDKNKMEVAVLAVSDVLDSLKYNTNIEFALRVYGHQSPNKEHDCTDTKLEVPFSKINEETIKRKLREISPRGTTPISFALQKTKNDFPPDPNARNILILITDGLEACEGDPCAVAEALIKNKAILKPFVIAVHMRDEMLKQLECIGPTVNVKTEQEFREAIWKNVNRSIVNTTLEVDLLDAEKRPIETDVNMTFYNKDIEKPLHNFYHTINARGNPDTIHVDPVIDYKLTIHTVPSINVDQLDIKPDRHNKIPIDAARGNLVVFMQENAMQSNQAGKVKYILRKKGTSEIVDIENLNVESKYLVGKYDLEVLTLPRIYIPDVEINQIKTTNILIPAPGLVTITSRNPGYGSIFEVTEEKGMEKIYTFNESRFIREVVALQPGEYKIIFRSKGAYSSMNTVEKSIKVVSNSSQAIKL